jgi:hypothetical protein
MGCWDIYCLLCSLPLNDNICGFSQKWLNKCTLLLNNNKNISNAREVSCNVNFHVKKREYSSLINYPKSFIVLHTDCLKFIKKEKNIKLRYSDFPNIISKINYKPISNYCNQFFDVDKYLSDGYSLVSPLKNNTILCKFILNIFNQLNIKSDRVGPRVSATLYKKDDMLIGSDNNIWKINNNKWTKVNDLEKFKFSSNINITNKNKYLLEDVYQYFEYQYSDEKYKRCCMNKPQTNNYDCDIVIESYN